MFKPQEFRARFAELQGEIAAIEAKSAPLRVKRDVHVQKARKVEDDMNADIRKAEKGLYEMKQELAMLSRALGGKTTLVGPAED